MRSVLYVDVSFHGSCYLHVLSGYKIMKQNFIQELEYELVKEIVILCGGDIEK